MYGPHSPRFLVKGVAKELLTHLSTDMFPNILPWPPGDFKSLHNTVNELKSYTARWDHCTLDTELRLPDSKSRLLRGCLHQIIWNLFGEITPCQRKHAWTFWSIVTCLVYVASHA